MNITKRISTRILFFQGSSNPLPNACWARISFFATYFKSRGHDVNIAGTFSPRSIEQAGLKYWSGIRIYNLCPTLWIEKTPSLIFNVFSSLIVYPLLALLLRPKLTLISVPPGEPAVGAFFSSKLIGAKVVFDVRDEWEDYVIGKISSRGYKAAYRIFKVLMTSIYVKSNLIVTVTPHLARSLLIRGVRDVRLVPNGADVSVFRPYEKAGIRERLKLRKGEFVLVYSGGIGGYYRLDIVVRAMARLDNVIRSKIKLLMVGSGGLPQLVSVSEKLGLKDNVVYLGVKDDKKELAQILSAGDMGVIPYDDNPLWKNSVPAKFYEYCSCGIPVVATVYDDSLLAKLIKENGIGLTVRPMDEKKLAEAIRYFYENELFRVVAGRKARELVETKFDRNKIAEEFLNLIKVLA
ncbi:MAG: glycosyltransferase family 4 protein [Candidatus Bathyarchaeia archaeon]